MYSKSAYDFLNYAFINVMSSSSSSSSSSFSSSSSYDSIYESSDDGLTDYVLAEVTLAIAEALPKINNLNTALNYLARSSDKYDAKVRKAARRYYRRSINLLYHLCDNGVVCTSRDSGDQHSIITTLYSIKYCKHFKELVKVVEREEEKRKDIETEEIYWDRWYSVIDAHNELADAIYKVEKELKLVNHIDRKS